MIANKTNRPTGGETAARVLLFDVETSPNLAYIWGRWQQDALGDFVKERQIISVAWKWLGEEEVNVLALPMLKSYKTNQEDNRELILKLHELISSADIVVGHNIDSFDDPMSNVEFLRHGLKPPPPHRTIDTLRFAKHKFRFNSNRLGDLGKRLKLGRKVKTGGFQLWADCLRGDQKAWARMMLYNKGDVVLLEKIYLKIRPWMKNHPNMNVADKNEGCPACRSKKLQRRGWSFLSTGKALRFQCVECGKWFQGKYANRRWEFK